MKRLILILFAAFALMACGQDAPRAPAVVPGPTFERSAGFNAEVGSQNVSEAYLLEKIHAAWAHNLGIVMGHLWYDGDVTFVSTKTWPDDHTVIVQYNHDSCGRLTVQFKDLAYDPERSDISYGRTKIAHQANTELSGHAYLYDLTDSSEPGHFQQTDSVTLEQARSVTLTSSTDFNVTASSETTVGGTFAGVGVEEKITVATGLEFKDEEARAESESKSQTHSHTFDVALPPFEATLITLDTSQVQSSTPFALDAVASFSVKMHVGQHCGISYPTDEFDKWLQTAGCWISDSQCIGSQEANLDWCLPPKGAGAAEINLINGGGCTFSFASVDRVDEWLRGVHERWPGMNRWAGGWIYTCRISGQCHAAYEALKDPEQRHIRLTGVQHRVYEDSIREVVDNVTGEDLDQILKDHSAEDCDPLARTCGTGALGAEVLGMPHHDPEPDPELDRVAERTAYLSDALDDALPLLTAAELADLIGKLMPAIIAAGA